MINISDQVKEAIEQTGRGTSDLAKWLGLTQRAVQKKLKEGNWKVSDLTILSEKLEYTFDVNANEKFAVGDHGESYQKASRQPIQLNISLTGHSIESGRVEEFLKRWDSLVEEFNEGFK
jgi:ribosome-binding protein aMBF1 (putative translation factor)